MAGARHVVDELVPDETRQQLNDNPAFQIGVSILCIVVGLLFAWKGIRACQTKEYTGKYGKVFVGKSAVFLGGLTVVVSVALSVVGLAMLLDRFM